MGNELSASDKKQTRLSSQARRFCDLFLADPSHDAGRAYVEAGYCVGGRSPMVEGDRLLHTEAVQAYLKLNAQGAAVLEIGRMLENRGMVFDLWRNMVRNNADELGVEDVPLEMRLAASRELAKASGLYCGTGGRSSPSVNINLGNSAISVKDPYAAPVGDGETIEVEAVPGGFGGSDGGAD